MHVDVSLQRIPLDSDARPSLARALELMLSVTEEGRNAVRGLRTAETEYVDLESSLSRIVEELAPNDQGAVPVDFQLVVEGQRRPLQPILRDEIYRIARESVINAFRHAPENGLALAPGSNNLQIAYTALSFTIPERVRFGVKLEGADKEWRDAGALRQAFYNHLGPGQYHFRVTASNNDGVWNETGATWDFRILPAYYQTLWFQGLLFGLACGLAWVLYERRVKTIAARMNVRLPGTSGGTNQDRARVA